MPELDSGILATPDGRADGLFFSSLDQETSFYVLRHGQSEGNATLTFQGHIDYPLDEVGESQARAAGHWLADKKVDAILCSPLVRASSTASIIARICNVPDPISFPGLVEVDVGIFSGVSIERAKQEYPDIYRRFQYSSWDAVPEAEPSSRLYKRAMMSWLKLREMAGNGARTIVCVAHGGTIQWLIRSTFGVSTWLPLVPSSNCGISKYEVVPTSPGDPAFVQWSMINFKAPHVQTGIKPVF
jgi:broad specificity phosphatase PhoE